MPEQSPFDLLAGEGNSPFDALVAASKKAVPPAKLQQGNYIDELMRQVAQGATFGWADEIAARMNALTGGAPYAQGVQAERERTKAFAEENPKTAFAAELGGGLATGSPGALKVMGLKSLPVMARLGLIGGTGGALSGAGYSEATDPAQVLQDAMLGGVTGAVLAPALGIGGNALLKGGGANLAKLAGVGGAAGAATGAAVSDFDPTTTGGYALGGALALPAAAMGGNKLINIGKDLLGKFGSGELSYGTRKIAEALRRGEMTVEDARAALQALGPEAAMIDLPNPNIRMLGEAVANAPGKPAAEAAKMLESRSAAETGKLREATRAATGSNVNYFQTIDELQEQAGKRAAPLYEKAYAANQQMMSPEIDQILSTDAGREALRSAAKRMSNRRSPMGTTDPELTAAKNEAVELGKMAETGKIAKGLKLETLDLVKRELDDMWLAAKKAAERGTGRAGDARDLNDLRRDFVAALDKADVTATKAEGGAYARGRAAYAGPTHAQDIMEEGLTAFKKAPEEIEAYVKKLPESDKQFFLHGFTRALDDIFMNTARGASGARKLLHDQGATENKIRAALGPQADEYIKQLETRIHFKGTEQDILRNSKTQRRQAAAADIGLDPMPLVDLAQGNTLSALAKLGGAAKNWLTQPSAGQIEQLGPMLFSPAQREAVLQSIGKRAQYNALMGRYLGDPAQALMALQLGAQPAYLSSGQR